MGWFDDSAVYVNVVTNKITTGQTTPIRNAVLSSSVRNSGISEGILAGMINGLGPRSNRFYNYANDPTKGTDGLPIGEIGKEFNSTVGSIPGDYFPMPGTYFPVVNLRKDGEFITEDTNPAKWASNKKCLKRLALNMNNMIDNISADRDDENGNPIPGNPVDQLDDVFFLLGADLYTKQEATCIYLFDYFEHIKDHVLIDQTEYDQGVADFLAGSTFGIPCNSIRFSNLEADFVTKVRFDYMHYTDHAGVLVEPYSGKNKEQSYTIVVPGDITQYDEFVYTDTSYALIKKQLTRTKWGDASDTYGVWTVYGLNHETQVLAYGTVNKVFRTIQNNPRTSGVESGTWYKYHHLTYLDAEFGRSGFYFPLCKEVLDLQYTIREEEAVVDCMMMTMHAAELVELEWYQQGWFRIVMTIMVAVVIYFSMGRLFKEGMSLIATITELAVQYGISYVINLLIEQVGGELGILLAAALAIYGTSRGNFSAANKMLPHAKELLVVTRAVTQVSNAAVKNDLKDLKSEQEDFSKTLKEHQEEMKESYAILAGDGHQVDYLSMTMQGRAWTNESVDDWLSRVKGRKNVAPLVKEAISTYHSRMKELPRIPTDDSYALV